MLVQITDANGRSCQQNVAIVIDPPVPPIPPPNPIPGQLGAWTVAFCCGSTSATMVGTSGNYTLGNFGNNAVTIDQTFINPGAPYSITINVSGTQPPASFVFVKNGGQINYGGGLSGGSLTLPAIIATGTNEINFQFNGVGSAIGTILIS
jgi:hypothetical protein